MATGTLSNISLNAVTTAGMYRLQGGITDLPPWADGRWQWSQLFVMHGGGDTVTQIIGVFTTGGVDGYLAYRNNGDPGWDDWRQLATATPPQEYALPLAAGIVNIPDYTSTYSKDQFGRVMINLYLDRADGSAFTTWHEMLATLPEGYRPAKDANAIGSATSSTTSGPVGLAVNHDGALRVYPYTHTETRVSCTFIFQAS